MCFARKEWGVDKVVLKVSVWAMFIAHSSVPIVKQCLWWSGKVWLELIKSKCSYAVIFDTRPDVYLWLHAIHILSKVGKGSAIWCKFRQTNPQDMWICVCVVSCKKALYEVLYMYWGWHLFFWKETFHFWPFSVERTRSIAIKLFASSMRVDSWRSWLSKANNTICSHCIVYAVQLASLFVFFQSSAFSVLCVVFCWSLGL